MHRLRRDIRYEIHSCMQRQQNSRWVDGDGFKYDSTTDFNSPLPLRRPAPTSQQTGRTVCMYGIYVCMVSTCTTAGRTQGKGMEKKEKAGW
jgi:hypothetical protein